MDRRQILKSAGSAIAMAVVPGGSGAAALAGTPVAVDDRVVAQPASGKIKGAPLYTPHIFVVPAQVDALSPENSSGVGGCGVNL